jgi:hypothetical protein
MSLKIGVVSGSVSQRYGAAPKCHGSAPTLALMLANFLFFPRRIAYINKLDKPAADVSMTVTSMMRRLETVPLVIQTPLGQAAVCNVHPQSEKCIPDSTFFRSGSYLQIYYESASYLSNLDRSMMRRLKTVPLVI